MENKIETFNIKDFDAKYYNHNLVIDASAGTGKTYSITQMVKKLVENGIDVKKILIVTYTEKATGELRDRIRKELNDVVSDKNDLDNLNIYTIHSFSQNAIKEFGLKADQPLNLDVIDEPTQVGDFFDRYVRENRELLDDIDRILLSSNDIRVVDRGENSKDLKKHFVETVLKYYLTKKGEVDEDIISLAKNNSNVLFEFRISDNPFESLYNDEGFRRRYELLKTSTDDIIIYFTDEIKKYLTNRIFNLPKKGYFIFDNCNISNSEREAIDFFRTNDGKKYPGPNSIEEYSATTDLGKYYGVLKNSDLPICRIFINELKNKKQNKKDFTIKCPKQFSLPRVSNIEEEEMAEAYHYFLILFELLEKMSFYQVLVYKYIDDFYLKWQEEKVSNKNQTFNDMLRTIRETLLNEDEPYPFKTALQEKYVYAIIDEFQDTNQLQFDTFKKIFMEDNNHHIIVVGDPKQSIYSFQGADLNVYQKAKKEILDNGGLSLTLRTNYRSSKSMIEECNKFFGGKFFKNKIEDEDEGEIVEEISEDIEEDNGIKFVDSNSPDGNKRVAKLNGEEIPPFHIGFDEEDENSFISESRYAKLAVKVIVDSCSRDKSGKTSLQLEGRSNPNVTFKDFTVLARTRSETVYIERELRKCGVPYIKYKDTGLFFSKECANWVAVLEAINTTDFTGNKRKKLKKALFTDFFDRTLEEINADYFNHDDCSEVRLINKWKSIARERKWEDLFDDIIFGSGLLSKLKSLDKLQSLTIYKQISNYCVSYLYDNHSLDDLIYRLKNSSQGDDEDDSGVVEIGTDFDAVKIMTIHASKGLQYPVVISVAGFKNINPKPVVYSAHDEYDDYKRKIVFSHDDAIIDEIHEWKRLLYVCYTRAEYINIIPYYEFVEKNIYSNVLYHANREYIENENANYGELLYNGDLINYSELKKSVREIIASNEGGTADIDTTADREALIKKEGGLKSYKNSYSSLSHPKNVVKDDEEEVIDEERDKEDSISDEFDLSEFDKNSIQIDIKLDTSLTYEPYDKFPRGATIGTTLHEVFENIDFTNPNANLEEVIEERLKANRIKITNEIKDYITNMVDNVLHATLPEIKANKAFNTFTLSELGNDDKKPEIEFNFNLNGGRLKNYCNGFIDLLFKRGEYYSILDWKSDTISDEFAAYNDKKPLKEHTDKHYSIQRVLYSYCLINWLKDIYGGTPADIFKNHFGGIYYVYIRGCNKDTGNGIYAQTWDSYEELEKAFKNIIKQKVRG